MPLSEPQRKYLRRLGHDRNPIVLVGQGGISPNLVAELDRALGDHGLVKVRARVGDRALRDQLLEAMNSATTRGKHAAVTLDHGRDLFTLVRVDQEYDFVMTHFNAACG